MCHPHCKNSRDELWLLQWFFPSILAHKCLSNQKYTGLWWLGIMNLMLRKRVVFKDSCFPLVSWSTKMLMFPFFSELPDWNRNWSQGKVPFTDPLCRAYEFFCLISCSFWAQHSKFSVAICIRLGISVTFQFKGSGVIQCWRCCESAAMERLVSFWCHMLSLIRKPSEPRCLQI